MWEVTTEIKYTFDGKERRAGSTLPIVADSSREVFDRANKQLEAQVAELEKAQVDVSSSDVISFKRM